MEPLNLEQPSLQLGLIFVVECGENPLAVLQIAGGFPYVEFAEEIVS